MHPTLRIIARCFALMLALFLAPVAAFAQDACGLDGPLAGSCTRARRTFTSIVQGMSQGGAEGAALAVEGCRRLEAAIGSLEVATGSQATTLNLIDGGNTSIGQGAAVGWTVPSDLRSARRLCSAITSGSCAPLAAADSAALVEGAGGTVDLGTTLASVRRALGRCQPVPPVPETTRRAITAELGSLIPLSDDLSARGPGPLAQLSLGLSLGRSRWALEPQMRLSFGPGSVAGAARPLEVTYYGASLGVGVLYPLVRGPRLEFAAGGEAFYGLLGRTVDTSDMPWAFQGNGLLSALDLGAASLLRWRPVPSGRWWLRASARLRVRALAPVDDDVLVGAVFDLGFGVETEL